MGIRRARLLGRHALALVVAVLAAVAMGWGGLARADDVVERLSVPTHVGHEVFLVSAPEAAVSPALRENLDLADKAGVVPPPTAGFELTSTVVVRLAAGGGRGAEEVVPEQWRKIAEVTAIAGLEEFALIRVPTVREAAALAEALRQVEGVQEAYLDIRRPQPLRELPTDPNFPAQWHLLNTLAPGLDLNVVPVWSAGRTGTGVTVGVIEDGWHVTHPDLAANYHLEASQGGAGTTSHGTSVAGLIGAVANNGLGGVGVAYTSRVSRLFRGTSSANATAFLHRNDLNAVKNNSWGPADNGRVTTMTSLERSALAQAATTGRDGLGTVIVWAAGNGGPNDRVDYDPYASSRYTLAIGAIDDDGDRSWYNESGSSMFAVAPSSGTSGENRFIYTTSGPTGYTASFGGTSASSPMACGVIALMLEARPELSWRDVQHILVRTARRCDPENAGWQTNGAGRWISHDYGFGLIDAAAAVGLAPTWTPVGPELALNSGAQLVNMPLPDGDSGGLVRSITIADNVRIETVEVEITAAHPYVGDLRIELTSPAGTPSLLAAQRADPGTDYANYVFTSFRHWDERSAGPWTLRVADMSPGSTGTWTYWRLRIYGTAICRVDWNEDGVVNSTDISAFITAWLHSVQTGGMDGDFNADGVVNSTDISAFITGWLAACP